MKKISILIVIVSILTVTNHLIGQDLVENKVDDFTGNVVKRTSWEILNYTMKFTAYCRISKINDNTFFELKMMMGTGSVFSISEGAALMFKLSNNEIIELNNLEYAITCNGCGARGFSGSAAQGIKVSYLITNEQADKLQALIATKIRIYTNDGYLENKLKTKYYQSIKNALYLVEH